jgi:hypothetical protein
MEQSTYLRRTPGFYTLVCIDMTTRVSIPERVTLKAVAGAKERDSMLMCRGKGQEKETLNMLHVFRAFFCPLPIHSAPI